MEVVNGPNSYQIGKQVGETGNYRLYLCLQNGKGRQCLLQVATSLEHNGGLQRSAYVLKELQRRAEELEEEYSKVKKDQKVLLNYGLGFPELVDSFISQEQGGRRINILAFRCVDEVSRMVPLINITEKDRLRVDLRTSAWIFGRTLKLLIFALNEGFTVDPTENNILIEPDQHYALIFDWTAAQAHSEMVAKEIQRQQISQLAQAVIKILGGDLKTGIFPDDGEDGFDQYTNYLLQLARGAENNAEGAYKKFYELIDSFWPRKFYPFTAKPLNTEK